MITPDAPALRAADKLAADLACPCLAPWKDGPCGSPFAKAYECYLASTMTVRGQDCLREYAALQACFVAAGPAILPPEEGTNTSSPPSNADPRRS